MRTPHGRIGVDGPLPGRLVAAMLLALLLGVAAVGKHLLEGGQPPPPLSAIEVIAQHAGEAEFTPLADRLPPAAFAVEALAPSPQAVAEHPASLEQPADLVEAAPPAAPPAATGPTFDHRPLRQARTIQMVVTAYSPDERSCGKWADGITASGYSVWTNGMKLVAADTRILPFRSVITVPDYHEGRPVPVLDRGGAIKGNRLDLLFPTHEEALKWGRRTLTVTVWEYAD